jgi:hypothetical protein
MSSHAELYFDLHNPFITNEDIKSEALKAYIVQEEIRLAASASRTS